jgi:hypothetical protein
MTLSVQHTIAFIWAVFVSLYLGGIIGWWVNARVQAWRARQPRRARVLNPR